MGGAERGGGVGRNSSVGRKRGVQGSEPKVSVRGQPSTCGSSLLTLTLAE